MRGSYLVLSTVVAVLVLGACSGGNQTTPSAGALPQYSPTGSRVVDSDIVKPRLLRLMQTPNHPPPRKHRITGAERARARAGGWQPVVATAPWTKGPETALLMTDGTVLVHDFCTPDWYSLAPDNTGNYVSGTWTKVASMPSNYAPLYFASAVLADGKLVINGGEYNGTACTTALTNLGAIYDPVANKWTAVAGPTGWATIGDAQSAVLSNGTYMIGNYLYNYQALFNEGTLTWTQTGPGNGKNDPNLEEGWALLPGGDLLAVDVEHEPAAEVYNPGTNMWSLIAPVPVNLIGTTLEIGPSTLRPNGTVFVAGASGLTAILNPKTGVWTEGPQFPIINGQQYDVADGPSSLLTNGDVMVPASPGKFNPGVLFYVFDGKNLKQIAAPPNAPNDSTFNIQLLTLPTGQVLDVDGYSDVEVYTPGRKGGSGYAPEITNVPTTLNPGTTYKITGRRFNGVSQANMYGDEAQEATNYPLVRITNNGTGHVVYCRTHGTTFMGVASNKKVSTKFDVPASIGTGGATLAVVANGIGSQPVSVTIP